MIVLPLIITPLVFTAIVSGLSARNGITTVATQFLRFKSEQLLSYANNQWRLLESNNLQDNQSFAEAAKSAVQSFAVNMTRSDTELIFAVTPDGTIEMQTKVFDLAEGDRGRIAQLIAEEMEGWQELTIGGAARVANVMTFLPFRWTIFVTEERRTFYATVIDLVYRVIIILGVSLAAALLMLIIFTGILTRPLRNVAAAMTDIITTNDLSRRVEVLYKDETGRLGHTFNLMVQELQNAYNSIKSYALRAVVAQAKEQKIRNIFQKYVPKDVIEQFFVNPERMLIGEDRVLAVLFSDIRGFTTISERMRPDEMVESLNQYFTLMVDTIMGRNGIVDKYIGDAIMAFFGAPVKREDDALQSVYSALEMLETLSDFNRWQAKKGRPEFRIGIGINYGAVTVGNIGSEKKMDYTVIGDMVNLASRLEGLTKVYKEPIIVSESVRNKIADTFPTRLLDKAVVKGRLGGVGVYTVKRKLNAAEDNAWKIHQEGMELFYSRQFPRAAECFSRVLDDLPDDVCAQMHLASCNEYLNNPPGKGWTGVVEMQEK